ncbi:MAG: hypothetical protein WAO58_12715 [Fimbriimonadaceae bacterium]
MTQSPAGTYENDILGNRTWLNRYVESTGKRYTWDAINRLASACDTTNGAGAGLIKLGYGLESELITGIGEALVALSCMYSAKSIASMILGGSIGGTVLGVLALVIHNCRIEIALSNGD